MSLQAVSRLIRVLERSGLITQGRLRQRADALQPPDGCHFTEVVPPERLAWVAPFSGMHMTSTLHDLGDGRPAVVIHQRHVPERMPTSQARAGFLTSLDRLEAHLFDLVRGDRS